MTAAVRYRPDIDGLRTVAILPVLLFHAGVPGLSGGFVGVDVFFVISGYLITGIIAREIDERRFSIVRFYERRIRRILPALVAVMAFVLAGAAWLYLPSDFRLVSRSIVAALLFCSNILFWSESSYFGASAAVKPMLHSWSLAVEEQFYIGFPLLLLLARSWGERWRKLLLLAIFMLSLALAMLLVPRRPDFAFYMLPTRAWELMAGALLAVGAVPAVRSAAAREAIAATGLVAILAAVFAYSEATPFPGAAALPPVLGSAALIHAAPGTRTGSLLSLRPVVLIGLISYSLYLWHWPVIVFLAYAGDAPLSGVRTVAAILLSLVLAILSWQYVERPFRSPDRVPGPRLFALAGATAAAMLVLSAAAMVAGGWPSRFSPQVLAMDAAAKSSSPMRKACHYEEGQGPATRAPCVLGARTAPTSALWGDSHGVEIAYALGEREGARGRSLAELTSSSCPPALGVEGPGRTGCPAQDRAVLDWIEAHPAIRTVIVAGYWANPQLAADPRLPGGLEAAIAALQRSGRRVVLIGAIPPNGFAVPRRLAHLAAAGRLGEATGTTRVLLARQSAYLRPSFERLRARGVTIVEPADTLCPTGRCEIVRGGLPLYFDAHHLSVAGARLVAGRIEEQVP